MQLGDSSKSRGGIRAELRRLVEIADDEETRSLVSAAELMMVTAARDRRGDLAAWIGGLREAVGDLDDMVDDLGEQRRRERLEKEARRKSMLRWFSDSSSDDEIDYKKMKIQTESLNKKFHKILQNGIGLGLQPGDRWQKQKRISEFTGDLPPLVGDVEQEKTKLINKLTSTQSPSPVIAIFGLDGTGKTTLARKVHDDLLIRSVFSNVVWVAGSRSLTEVKLLRAILKSFGGKPGETESWEQMQNMLCTMLAGAKRFLLVLDDVWGHQVRENFLEASLEAQEGSRILLTTRDETVMSRMHLGPDDIHKVHELSFPACLSLLHTSAGMDERHCDKLKQIGISIIQKCYRVPLAIKVMGGLLGTKNPTEKEWQEVINETEKWIVEGFHDATKNIYIKDIPNRNETRKIILKDIPDGMKEICVAIYLAYFNLPHHLKLCFLYCLQLPEEFVIRPQTVTQLWIAEGFIKEQDNCSPEDIAEEYYKELVVRNLLQPEVGSSDMSRCTVHDCIKSLLQPFTGDNKSTATTVTEGEQISRSFRTAIVVYKNPSSERGLEKGLKGLVNLRSLDLTGTGIRYIPKSIMRLLHLRLLNLSLTQVLELPESIQKLRHLQFLILRCCYGLQTLPKEISSLVNLRTLDLEGSAPHTALLPSLAALEELTVLHGFVVKRHNAATGKDHQNGWPIEDLRPLKSLRSLQIMNIDRVPDDCSAEEAALSRKSCLTRLELCGSATIDTQVFVPDEENVRWLSVLTALRPPRCLEYLKVASYYGKSFPDWMMHLQNLQRLVVADCKLCESLPALGQLPQLRFLTITGCHKLRTIERGTDATLVFPKLEQLDLSDMQILESFECFRDGDFPSLTKFYVENSPRLRSLLPSGHGHCKALTSMKVVGADILQTISSLPALKELVVQDCRELAMISDLPELQVLLVSDCSRLKDVKGVASLRHVHFVDRVMKNLPDWLTGQHASVLQTLTIAGTAELLGKLVPDTENWSAISNIDKVYANFPDGTLFLACNKGRLDFLMIKPVDGPQLEDPYGQAMLTKIVRVASWTGLANTVKQYFIPLTISFVFLLLATRDLILVGFFVALFAALACIAGVLASMSYMP
uniref:AAA+ ATPase domain-containing protein n=2 Tax=Oryza brachyantha TaxID=4533 RepID=J3MWG2_ORYBR